MAKQEPRVIKRYANRKLYDTVERQFTTLTELAKLVEGGTRVVVSDHDTGEDRTDEVLAQALGRRMRGAPGASGASDLLAGLLRTSGSVAQELAQGLTGAEAEPAPEPKKTKKSGKKSSGKSGKSAAKKDPKDDDLTEAERQEEEIRELRSQVSELTQAVNLLLQEKLAERGED